MGPLHRLLLPALLAVACASAPPERIDAPEPVRPRPSVALRERWVEYDVTGATIDAVSRALDVAAPRIEGKRYRGTTRWSARWSFRYRPEGAGCAITDADVRVLITTTVPRWVLSGDPEPGLAERWAAYRAALDRHEAGHRDLAVEAANEVDRALRGVRTDCGVVAEEANARADAIVERYRQKNRRYDRDTKHGHTQGATWPGPGGGADAVHAGSPPR